MKPIRLRQARRPIEIARDADGVPHISGESWLDVLYGLGYAQALDRRTQIQFSRVIGTGRACELLADNPTLEESDRFFRQAALYVGLEREAEALDDETREQLEVYCAGVNDGLAQAGRSLPMRASRFRPEPWNTEAVLLTGNLLAFAGLALGQQRCELVILELIHSGCDPEKLRELYAPHLEHADFELLRQLKIPNRLSDEALAQLPDLPRMAGSNAWAVSPQRSASGSALLASDPHLEIERLPCVWYESTLRWGDEYLLGVSLPGTPIFGVGRNRELAWGTTYAMGDVCDYFVEDCRVQEDRVQYRRGDAWHDFEVRRETFQRKNGAAGPGEETLEFFHNPQGVLHGDPRASGDGHHLLAAWTGYHEGGGGALGRWLQLPRTHRVDEAMSLVRACPQPTLAWVFADRAGHIGRQVSGWFPRRREQRGGLIPSVAWDEQNHWQGWVPFDELPAEYDPPCGYVAAANEDVNVPGEQTLATLAAADYRVRRIRERLAELPAATLADMQSIQYDTVSLQVRDLLPRLLPAIEDEGLRQRLADWDGDYSVDSREATLFWRLYRHLVFELAGVKPADGSGIGARRLLYLAGQPGVNLLMVGYIDRLLEREQSAWWHGRTRDEVVAAAARRTAGHAERAWGEVNHFTFENRFLPGFLARTLRLHLGPIRLPGCHATPFQGLLRPGRKPTVIGPSYHFVSDLAADEAWTNLPGGVSENRFTGFYRNDLDRWLAGEYKRLAP